MHTRSVPLAQFYTGMKQNLLKVGEFIEAIEVPRLKAGDQLINRLRLIPARLKLRNDFKGNGRITKATHRLAI